MIKIKKDILFSPLTIFALYIAAAFLAIMGFHLIFPGEPVPLAHFSLSWRLIQGVLEYINLFPALVLSSLVIPFGFKVQEDEKTSSFSPQFFESFKKPIITAIAASTLYALLFTLALPLARDYKANLLYQGRLHHLAREKAQISVANGEWLEAAQFLGICERIWPNCPEISQLRIEIGILYDQATYYRRTLPYYTRPETASWPETHLAVSVTDALVMAETALAGERYFDAHWLATLAGRLAQPGSPELSTANRLAGRAWSGVNSMAPNARETRAFDNFRLKRDGYEAMLANDWIRSYYIFRELFDLTPDDPDVIRYLALSEEGVNRTAFFLEEIELTLGQILTGALFSFPFDLGRMVPQGRLVLRVSSLSTAPDYAYGIDAEMMAFSREGQPLWSITAPYIKILPFTHHRLDASAVGPGQGISVFLRALDREDQSVYWAPEITSFGQTVPGNTEITLPVSWDSFLLLADVRRGISGLSTTELRRAAESLGNCGHLPQIFETELLKRFARPLFFLPLCIFAIGLGWQYRPLKRPRYMGIPMLGILPVVFNAAVLFSRYVLNNLGIWAVLSFGFTTAAIFFTIGIVITLVLSFIVLASKHG